MITAKVVNPATGIQSLSESLSPLTSKLSNGVWIMLSLPLLLGVLVMLGEIVRVLDKLDVKLVEILEVIVDVILIELVELAEIVKLLLTLLDLLNIMLGAEEIVIDGV